MRQAEFLALADGNPQSPPPPPPQGGVGVGGGRSTRLKSTAGIIYEAAAAGDSRWIPSFGRKKSKRINYNTQHAKFILTLVLFKITNSKEESIFSL